MAVDPRVVKRVAELRKDLAYHNHQYYVLDAPVISDEAYDSMLRELRALEARHPELVTPDSPTQRTGSSPAAAFAEVVHGAPMLSLANAFNHDELRAWYERTRKLLQGRDFAMTCELKIDGLAVSLLYRDGLYVQGATRGDGLRGEEVTNNLRTVRSIPLRMLGKPPSLIEVRGEVYLSLKAFQQINEQRAAEGHPLFANPRNCAAGSVRLLDPSVTASRPLDIFVYGVGSVEGAALPSTQWELLAWLRERGFRTNPHTRLCNAITDAKDYYHKWLEAREPLGYETDGAVIKANDLSLWDDLGVVGREPRWAIAYKWPARQAVTRLLDIGINIGRTGSLNPYAILEPVSVGGVTVKQATLHNEDDIRRKDLRIGDWVVVERAGEVIPQVVAPLTERRTGSERAFTMPALCPVCGGTVVRDPDEAMSRCINVSCRARIFQALKHFASVMDIEGLGAQWCAQLLEARLVADVADLYGVTKEQLLGMERMGDVLATKIVNNIAASKDRSMPRLLFALGIFHVGAEIAELLASHFPTMVKLTSASEEDLMQVPGIGPEIARSVASFFRDEANRKLVERLRQASVRMEADEAAAQGGLPFIGKDFCFTGAMASLLRSQAEEAVKALGGTTLSSVTRKTQFLVVGAEPGENKVAQARKFGTRQLTEDEFVTMLREAQRAVGQPR
ncbi:MAG: NAD-dependent DNA ligase LigA [Dehalococcoidia bacterium]|nr:NAD-dependent DNA ligase LigA [Dehalococcoidia bacterium]